MKNTGKTLFFVLILFSSAFAHAYSNPTKEQTYTNGFAIELSSQMNTAGMFLTGAYYFGRNNNWQVYVATAPYQSVNNASGIEKDDSWNTYIGAGLGNFIPLAREKLQNKFFFRHYVGWGQTFGKSAQNNAQIKSSWAVKYGAGFQYRFNDSVYLSLLGPVVNYSQTKFRNTPNSVYKTNAMMWTWNILSSGSVFLGYKF